MSTVAVSEERGRYKLGTKKKVEEPPEVWSLPENFGDTSVLVEDIRRRLMSLPSRFPFEIGRRIWISRNNNQARTDMTDPLATGCRTCKGHGAVGKKHWFSAYPYYE